MEADDVEMKDKQEQQEEAPEPEPQGKTPSPGPKDQAEKPDIPDFGPESRGARTEPEEKTVRELLGGAVVTFEGPGKQPDESAFSPAQHALLLEEIDRVVEAAISSSDASFYTEMLIRRAWADAEEFGMVKNAAFGEGTPLHDLKHLVHDELFRFPRMDIIWVIRNKPIVAGLLQLHVLDDDCDPFFRRTLTNRLVAREYQQKDIEGKLRSKALGKVEAELLQRHDTGRGPSFHVAMSDDRKDPEPEEKKEEKQEEDDEEMEPEEVYKWLWWFVQFDPDLDGPRRPRVRLVGWRRTRRWLRVQVFAGRTFPESDDPIINARNEKERKAFRRGDDAHRFRVALRRFKRLTPSWRDKANPASPLFEGA